MGSCPQLLPVCLLREGAPMGKLPAFQFYPADWRKDIGVQSLSFHDRGVWFEMLCLMHESERRGVLVLNGQPIGEEMLARILGLDKQILTTTLTTLLTSGVASREQNSGAIFSRRMVRDENIRKVRAEAGSKGGNPVLLKQISTTGDKQIPTPSSSSSFTSSNTKTKPTPKAPPSSFTLPFYIDPQIWSSWLEMRRKIRNAPFTERAQRGILDDLGKLNQWGIDPNDRLLEGIKRGWRGVLFPDDKPSTGNGENGHGQKRARQSAAKDRVNGNRRAIAEALAARGVDGPWNSPRTNGAAVSQSGFGDTDAGVSGGFRAAGHEILSPKG